MLYMPPRIALDGCRNAYICVRLAQFSTKDRAQRTQQMLVFARQGRWYAEHVRRTGSVVARCMAWHLLRKIERACREAAIDTRNEGVNAVTPVISRHSAPWPT